MAGEKIVEKSEAVTTGLKSDSSTKLINKDMGTVKDGKASDSISPIPSMVGTETGVKGGVDQGAVPEQGSYYSMASCCDYYYPGYNGNYNNGQSMPSDNGFYLYYLPGYTPYTTGYIGSDGKQQPYTTSGYLQQPVSYGSDGLPCYSWCYANGDLTYGTASKSRNFKSMAGSNGSVKSNGFNSSKTNSGLSNKNSSLPLNHKTQQFESSNFSKSSPQTQPLKQSNRAFSPEAL
nr:YTH domain-containing family protein 1 isoform X2 [Ipomoea batatas]